MVDYSGYLNRNEYRSYVIRLAQAYSSSFHTFYQHYVKHRFIRGLDLSTLYKPFNVTKISVNWETKTVETNYMKEAENIVHLAKLNTKNDVYEQVLSDIDKFFNSKYLQLGEKDKKIGSNYIVILYYLASNYLEKYDSLFTFLQNEIRGEYRK